MTTAITKSQPSILLDAERFAQAQRVGGMMALSPLFPEHLRKGGQSVAIANAVLVQDMADRLRRPPLEVAQNIYFVSGKPGWSTSYLIGLANESGKLKKPINWKVEGTGDKLKVTAFAELKSGAKIEYSVTMEMAKAEGWVKNPKYRSMPELMLRYRSATALIRLYMPEVTMGVPAQEEVLDPVDMRDITPQQTSESPSDSGSMVSEEVIPDAETVDENPKAKVEPEKSAKKPKPKEKPKPKPDSDETSHDPETGEVVDEESGAGPDMEPDNDKSPEDVERHVELKDAILSEIEACDDEDMLRDVIDMYSSQIEQITNFDDALGEEITTAREARNNVLSADKE